MTQRNNTVDIIRGFAMLMVVLGHTMSGTTAEFSDSLLFQIIWTLQMPLFIIISGYVTRYSRPIESGKALWKFVKKRSLAYLLPWAVWTFVVRGLIFGQTSFFDFHYLLWTMDAGYWFLITIWTINMIFGVADYVRNKFGVKSKAANIVMQLFLCGIGMSLLAGVGLTLGLSFFCIKLTLYYFPIYLLGYIYGQLQDRVMAMKYSAAIMNWSLVLCLGLWLACITRFDFFGGADEPAMIMFSFVVSVLGCVAITSLFTANYPPLMYYPRLFSCAASIRWRYT